jgi:hypothetical protein
MKKLLLLTALFSAPFLSFGQCTTTNATSCVCDDASNDCDLLPDINVSWDALENYMNGPTEYSQTGNGANDGRLRITGSTPNIGHGAFTVRGEDDQGTQYFVCGLDTFNFNPGVCADGSSPKHLIFQRIYHKNGNAMSYYDIPAGGMTFHPTHGHNHVDDWGVFTLRLQDLSEPDPRDWPIVGDGAKLGFCLMDYGTCTYYAGHCRDVNHIYQQGNTMLNGDFPNYGLGGGNYNCSVVEQGISSGYTDIYSENLDGMWVNIPPGTCNGDYWIVADIDPHNVFLEEDETNNYTAVPFTLTQQDAPGNPVTEITSDMGATVCAGQSVTLTATAGSSTVWSTGATTQSITVSQAGTYTATVTTYCGTAASAPFVLTVNPTPNAPVADNDTVCVGQTATLTAAGTNLVWYDDQGNQVGTGASYTTPTITASTDYYVEDMNVTQGTNSLVGPVDNSIGGGGNFTGDQWLVFDVLQPMKLNSVKVYALGAGDRTLQILDQGGNLVKQGTFTLPDGESRIQLDWDIPGGSDYEFRTVGTPDMYRNNAGVSYPYNDPLGAVSITSSSAGGDYYYFYYDWDITVGYSECVGPQTMVTAVVDCATPVDNIDMTNVISVYPNPSNGAFTFEVIMPEEANLTYSVVDMVGKQVYSRELQGIDGIYKESVNLENVAPGIYSVSFKIGKRTYFKKLVIER